MAAIIVTFYIIMLIVLPILCLWLARRNREKKIEFWTFACAIPSVLLPFAIMITSLSVRDGCFLKDILGAIMIISGPAGPVITLSMEFNFPYDSNWIYFIVLVLVTTVQWLIIWLIGIVRLRKSNEPTIKTILILGSIFIVIGFCAFVHGVVCVALHT